ncbi:hypothetical protein HN51_071571 [Arachis hypogaea]
MSNAKHIERAVLECACNPLLLKVKRNHAFMFSSVKKVINTAMHQNGKWTSAPRVLKGKFDCLLFVSQSNAAATATATATASSSSPPPVRMCKMREVFSREKKIRGPLEN